MAAAQNFRSAINGFNREDVVHYIEYLNSKHNGTINQLKSENQILTDELAALRAQPVANAELEAQCAQLQEENQQLQQQIETLTAQLAQQSEQDFAPANPEVELEAYRRAEQAERTARERAQQIYYQATGALADATAQVDEAAEQFKDLSQRINAQLAEMQATVERSKNALLGAATTMYTICPTESDTL